ncbi:MAG: hypothetical protein K2N51_14740 [Lachnospiraceae bacterium]|nr:hypothetical protein [Lachnospiraceae bacterium]
MNFIEEITEYQDKILDNGVLIEYNLFFDNVYEKYCRFAIDEYEEIEKLNDVIKKIRESDKNAEIYVCTYGIDFMDNGMHIYADTLWINTTIDLEKIYTYFENYREVEPSDIVLLSEDEMIDGIMALVFLANGNVEDYKAFIQKKELNKIKSLYWG